MGRGDRITSIAGLKKAIEELQSYTEGEIRKKLQILDSIGEFEAGLRGRLEEQKRELPDLNFDFTMGAIEELRRILGEGEE